MSLKENEALEKPIAIRSYLLGLLIIFASSYSQYLIDVEPIVSVLIVYGIPVIAVSLLWGKQIIRRTFNRTYTAVKFGLGLFGAFAVLGLFISILLLLIIVAFDPEAINFLMRPNPVLQIPPELAWVMVWFSLLVVGPVEEYLFRGFIYGGLMSLFKNRHWLSLAFVSSIFFSAVHLYYAFVYGVASLILFTDIITFSVAMAATYYLSDGNLLVPAIIHGTYDATAFVGVATSPEMGVFLRESMISIGIVIAFLLFIQKAIKRRARPGKLIVNYCYYCGQKVLFTDAKFCPSCGKALNR